MNILHAVHHFYPCTGGVEAAVDSLCRGLVSRGHRSDVVCLNTCAYNTAALPAYEMRGGTQIYRMPYLDLTYYKLAPRLLHFLKPYDVIHLHSLGFFADFLVCTKPLHRKPLVLSTHGAVFHTPRLSVLKKLYFYGWARMMMKGIDRIIAVSANDYELFSRITSRATWIPHGLDLTSYTTIKRQPEKNTYVFIGRLARNKRLDHLLHVIALLKEEQPTVKLTIAGEDWRGLRKELETLVRRLGLQQHVIFTGRISEEEKHALLGRAQFFVSASEYEGFGISVLEAMAAGVPVLASPIAAFNRLIDQGKNGFLIPFSDPTTAARMIQAIAPGTLAAVSSRAKKAAQRYDWRTVMPRIEEVYTAAVQGRHDPRAHLNLFMQ